MTSSGVYTIAEVEAMTGLSAEVLRQWERRYGFPKPRRTPGGHRLYSAEDVEALKTIKRWLEEGATPKAAIRRYLAQEVRPEDLGTGLLEALLRGDLAGAEALFRRGLRFWGPEGVLEHLLLPVLRLLVLVEQLTGDLEGLCRPPAPAEQVSLGPFSGDQGLDVLVLLLEHSRCQSNERGIGGRGSRSCRARLSATRPDRYSLAGLE